MSLADARYLSLTSFRRDGTAVATPVWVVSDDGRRLLVWTGAETWKAKRIRRNPRVLVAPCTASGKLRGKQVEATARFVDEGLLVQRLLRKKYRLQKRALEVLEAAIRMVTRRPERPAIYIEIVPTQA